MTASNRRKDELGRFSATTVYRNAWSDAVTIGWSAHYVPLCSVHDRAVVAPKEPGKIDATANLRFLLIFAARSATLRTVQLADPVCRPAVVR